MQGRLIDAASETWGGRESSPDVDTGDEVRSGPRATVVEHWEDHGIGGDQPVGERAAHALTLPEPAHSRRGISGRRDGSARVQSTNLE
jgi:hypothetical protein